MITNMKKIIAGMSLLSIVVVSLAAMPLQAQSNFEARSAIPSTAPAVGAPAPAAPAPSLVAAPRDEDQVAAKDKEADFVLQKAARN